MDASILSGMRQGTSSVLTVLGDDYLVTRSTRVRTLSGGYKDAPPTIVGTLRMLVESAGAGNTLNSPRNVEGMTRAPLLAITAAYDADLVVGDVFLWQGRRAVVDSIDLDRSSETTALAVIHG
jgi:hypothetical protein